MNVVFADAAFWIALREARDKYNKAAVALARELLNQRTHLVITPLVFAEVQAYFSRSRELRERVIRECWENPVVRIEQPTFEDQTNAIKILRAQTDKSYSFCDAVSFALMLRMQIDRVVTFDDHFHQFGRFHVLNERSM